MISQLCLFGLLLEGNYFLLVSAAVLGERVPPHITRPRDGSCAPHSLLGTCNPLYHRTWRTQGLSLVPLLLVPSSSALLFFMSSHTPTAAAFSCQEQKQLEMPGDGTVLQAALFTFSPIPQPNTPTQQNLFPFVLPFFPSLGAILADFSQAERWNRCVRVCAHSCLASAVLRELWLYGAVSTQIPMSINCAHSGAVLRKAVTLCFKQRTV